MKNLHFNSHGHIIKTSSSKQTNKIDTTSPSKNLLHINRFKPSIRQNNFSMGIDHPINKSEIQNFIIEKPVKDNNINNTAEMLKNNNCDSNISIIPKFKTCRYKKTSEFVNDEISYRK